MEGFSGNRKFNDQVLRKASLLFKEAKNAKEAHDALDKINKEINDRYKPAKEGLETKTTGPEKLPDEAKGLRED